MSFWEERAIRAGEEEVLVAPHAWERASAEILRAIGGRGMIMRGRIWYRRPDPRLSNYPHTPQLDWDGDVTFNDVWNLQRYWLTWVVGNDGKVYDPMRLFPEIEPIYASERTLDPFGPVVQALLDRMANTSWQYAHDTLVRLDYEAFCQRPLDDTEFKPFGDILMLPVLDRVLPAPFAAAPSDGGAKLVATRAVRKNEMVGAYPVDSVINHSVWIREIACPESTARRFRYPLKPSEVAALCRAKEAAESEPIVDLIKRGTLIEDTNGVIALSTRAPERGTFYNCHAARTHDTDYNATKIMIRVGNAKAIHLIAIAERDILPGEEIVVQTDELTKEAIDTAIVTKSRGDHAPRQEVYAFTDLKKVVDLNLL